MPSTTLHGIAQGKLNTKDGFLLPRWQYRQHAGGPTRGIVFAFAFRSCPQWLVVEPGSSWSLLSDDEFARTFVPVNKEAQECVERIGQRRPEFHTAYMEGAYRKEKKV